MTERRAADEDILAEMINDELEIRSSRIAAMMGPPPGTEHVTGKRELELWSERDPDVDIMAEYQNFLMQGMSDEDAKSAATVKAYPARGTMILSSAADDDGRVKYAQRMRRLSEKGMEQEGDDVPRSY